MTAFLDRVARRVSRDRHFGTSATLWLKGVAYETTGHELHDVEELPDDRGLRRVAIRYRFRFPAADVDRMPNAANGDFVEIKGRKFWVTGCLSGGAAYTIQLASRRPD